LRGVGGSCASRSTRHRAMANKPIEDVLFKVARRIGRRPDDVEPYVDLLRQHWYEDQGSLLELTQEDLQAIGIPLRITKELALMGFLADAGGEGLAIASEPHGKGKGTMKDKGKGKGKDWDRDRDRDRDRDWDRDRDNRKGKGKDKGKDKGRDRDDYSKGKGKDKGKDKGKEKGKEKGKDKGKGKGKGDSGKGGKGKGDKGDDPDVRQKAITIQAEGVADGFPWKAKIFGEANRNAEHIRSQVQVRLWLKGWPNTDDPLRLMLYADKEASDDALDKAEEMCSDLLETIYEEAGTWEPKEPAGDDADELVDEELVDEEGEEGEEDGERREKGKSKGKGKGKKGKRFDGKGKSKGKGKGKRRDRDEAFEDGDEDEGPPQKRSR